MTYQVLRVGPGIQNESKYSVLVLDVFFPGIWHDNYQWEVKVMKDPECRKKVWRGEDLG